MRILKSLGLVLGILLVLLFIASFYYLGSEEVPEETAYELDFPALRSLARSLPGELPSEIRFENIADGGLPRAAMLAGESFDIQEMPRPVFQVLHPDGSFVLIDVAYDRASHEAERNTPESYSDPAWRRLVGAMEKAAQIVVTHEHGDHMGGLAAHPRPEKIADQVRLNLEQSDEPRSIDVSLPSTIAERIEPLDYTDALAIAPGVVLKRAAGHTPGSQMVFVALANGKEFLFLGDVVWNLDAITMLKYRPRGVTDLILDEDRAAVLDQIRALRNVYDEARVSLVVSHDARTFSDGAIVEGFAQGTF